MIQPEIWHILFAVVGLAVGWYVKHQSIKVPPEVLTVVEDLLARQQQDHSRNLLQDLLDAVKSSLSAAKPPAK
jgi:hypothetical protein